MNTEKKSRKKLYIIIAVIIAVIAIGVLIFITNENQRKEALIDYQSSIQTEVEELNTLEDDIYFPVDYKEKINQLQSQFDQSVKEENLDGLKDLSEQGNDLITEIQDKIDTFHKLYTQIQDEITEVDELKKDYFASQYDVRAVDEEIAKAQKTLDEGKFEEYEAVYTALTDQIAPFETFLDEKNAGIINKVTNLSEEFPFGVNAEQLLPEDKNDGYIAYIPIKKQSSHYPTAIYCQESEVTDYTLSLTYDFGEGHYNYNVIISQEPTKEILVQDKEGNITTALVNSVLHATPKPGWESNEELIQLTNQPAYLYVDKDGAVNIVLPNVEGQNYYIPYNQTDSTHRILP